MRRIGRERRITLKPGTAFILTLLVAAPSIQTTHAGELAYGVGYYVESSDNIRRTPTNTVDDVTNSVFAGFTYLENGPVLDAHLTALAEYRDYKYDTYNDGPLYYADASLLWRIAPQRLSWVLVDRYDQITRDTSLPDTRDNQVDANVLSTGPDIYVRLGQVNTLALELRYGKATYGQGYGEADNSSYGGSLRWLYAANSEMTYSLNYQASQIYYDDEILNDNYSRQDFFVRAETHQARSRFLLDLGITKIDREKAGETNGPVARLTWSQQLTSESSASILLAGEYLDTGTDLLSTATSTTPVPGAPPPSNANGGITTDLYYQKRAELFYGLSGGYLGLNLRAFYRDIDYESVPQDRLESGEMLDVTYNTSSALATTIYGRHMDVHYQNVVRDDWENEAGIRFLYRLNRNVSATLDVWRSWRYSTDPLQEYTDNQVLLALLYSSSPLFAPTRRTR